MMNKMTNILLGITTLFLLGIMTAPIYADTAFELQCKESHVLVERPNGKMACVTEGTSEKLGWKIIQTFNEFSPDVIDGTSEIFTQMLEPTELLTENDDTVDDLPTQEHTASQSVQPDNPSMVYSSSSHGLDMFYDFEMSKLPKLGETATLTINMTYPIPHALEDMKFGFEISDGLEFVDVEPTKTVVLDYDSGMKYEYMEIVDIRPNELKTFKVTVMAIEEGYNYVDIYAFGADFIMSSFIIGENETVYYDREIHSHLHPANQRAVSGSSEPGFRPNTSPCPGSLGSHPSTEEEYRVFLAEIGNTSEEIDQFIEEKYETVVLLNVQSIVTLWKCHGNSLEEIDPLVSDYFDDFVLEMIDSYDGFVADVFEMDLTDDRFILQCDSNSKQCEWVEGLENTSDDLSTQNFSFLPAAYATSSNTIYAEGHIRMRPSITDDTNDSVTGIEVCAQDYDYATGTYHTIKTTQRQDACDYTNERGKFIIRNIPTTNPRGTNFIDLSYSITSKGHGSVLLDKNNNHYKMNTDIQPNVNVNNRLDYIIPSSAPLHGAAQIIDAVEDGMDFFDDHPRNRNLHDVTIRWHNGQTAEEAFGVCGSSSCYERDTHICVNSF